MTHLSPEELIDSLDEALSGPRAAHLAACEACRTRADAARAALREASAVSIPEPSPLFWEHFSARVREAVAAEPVPARLWWPWPRWSAAALLAAAVIAALSIVLVRRGPNEVPDGRAFVAREAPQPSGEPDLELASGTEWILVLAVADGVDWDVAGEAGLQVRPGAADRAALDLSIEERRELERILRQELAEPKS